MSYSLDKKNGTFENRPSKGRSGTSGLNFYLGLTGVKTLFLSKIALKHYFHQKWPKNTIFTEKSLKTLFSPKIALKQYFHPK